MYIHESTKIKFPTHENSFYLNSGLPFFQPSTGAANETIQTFAPPQSKKGLVQCPFLR